MMGFDLENDRNNSNKLTNLGGYYFIPIDLSLRQSVVLSTPNI